MNIVKTLIVSSGLGALAACGGSNSGADEFVLSSGVLDDVELPTGENLSELPAFVQDLVGEFDDLNTTNATTTTLPVGGATYSGTMGFEVDEDAFFVGDLVMAADFDSRSFDGTYSDISGVNEDGDTLNVVGSVPVMTTIGSDAEGVTFAGTAEGDVTLEGDNYRFNVRLNGAFGGDNADIALADVEGNIFDYSDDSYDDVFGLAALEKD